MAVASSDAGATLWVVAAGPTAAEISVAKCVGDGTEEMGSVSLGEGDDLEITTPPSVTSMAAAARRGGGVVCVAGCDDGRLFLVECAARGGVRALEMRRDTSGRGAGGGGSLTPSKWGAAALSATKAALSFLREPSVAADAAVTEVRSLSWAPAAASGGMRLLALTDATLEEWEVDGDGGGYGLVQTHRATSEIARALRTDDFQRVRCDGCQKWRKIPGDVDTSQFPKRWFCVLNRWDPARRWCAWWGEWCCIRCGGRCRFSCVMVADVVESRCTRRPAPCRAHTRARAREEGVRGRS